MRCRSRVTCWFPQRRTYSLQSPSGPFVYGTTQVEERETHLGTIVFPSREQILQMGVLTHTDLQGTWSELLCPSHPKAGIASCSVLLHLCVFWRYRTVSSSPGGEQDMFRNLFDFPGVVSGDFVSEVFGSTVPAKQMFTGRLLVVPSLLSKSFFTCPRFYVSRHTLG